MVRRTRSRYPKCKAQTSIGGKTDMPKYLGDVRYWVNSGKHLLSLSFSGFVQVFGCRHDDAIHALRRPASEKRQGTKSREVGHRRCRGRYGDLAAVRDLSAGQFFEGCAGVEGMHNFGVMAQVLLTGESRFPPHVISKS